MKVVNWEYRIEILGELADLNPYGKDGWELIVAESREGGQVAYYFRRPLDGGIVVSPAD